MPILIIALGPSRGELHPRKIAFHTKEKAELKSYSLLIPRSVMSERAGGHRLPTNGVIPFTRTETTTEHIRKAPQTPFLFDSGRWLAG